MKALIPHVVVLVVNRLNQPNRGESEEWLRKFLEWELPRPIMYEEETTLLRLATWLRSGKEPPPLEAPLTDAELEQLAEVLRPVVANVGGRCAGLLSWQIDELLVRLMDEQDRRERPTRLAPKEPAMSKAACDQVPDLAAMNSSEKKR